VQPAASADSCRDLSGQNFTGQLPDAITRLRLLSSMCARVDSSLIPLSPLRTRRNTPFCTLMRAPVCPIVPLHGVRSAWCRRNVAQNALTGRFPAFVSSMPSIANLYVAHARSFYVPPPLR
jgi:hypothetical protein